jgi:cytochrome c556
MKKSVGLLVATLALSACGGGSSTSDTTAAARKINPKYADFCLVAQELDQASNDTHGNDPMAMSDPAKMEAAWKTIMTSSKKLFDESPLEVKSDVKLMLDGMTAMDKIYATYQYNLSEMKAVPQVAKDLNAIASDQSIAAASQRFKTFMSSNCGL